MKRGEKQQERGVPDREDNINEGMEMGRGRNRAPRPIRKDRLATIDYRPCRNEG